MKRDSLEEFVKEFDGVREYKSNMRKLGSTLTMSKYLVIFMKMMAYETIFLKLQLLRK